MKSATIVDYGVGNILSVRRALEHCGGDVVLANKPSEVLDADYLVLPGVGAFRDGMAGLRKNGLDEAVLRYAESGRPMLGICLGMQMLASRSFEFGTHKGLDVIPGEVVAIPKLTATGQLHKIPYIGWAPITETRTGSFENTPLKSISPGEYVYLVHSFHLEPCNPADKIAFYDYDGVEVTASVRHGNIFGCQFHPEKSGAVGLRIVAAFLGA
jgi:glutamine amidotransferase